MRRIGSFAILLLGAAGAFATVFGSVRGIVHDPQHRPVPDVKVILKARASDYTQSALTDSAGQFQFDAVPLGEYTVAITDPTFVADQQTVTVLSGTAPILHLELRLPSQSQPRGSHANSGTNWLKRTVKKFLAMRRAQHDLSSVLMGPVRARLAAPQRLPYLPARMPALVAPQAQAASA